MNKVVLFDLDGTLTDSKEGIAKSIRYALNKFGIKVEKLDSLYTLIGTHLIDVFGKHFNLNDKDIDLGIKYYREYFLDKGKFQNKLYLGVLEFLNNLKSNNFTLSIATSKPTPFAEEILEHFGLSHFFKEIVGSNLDNTRIDKPSIIKYALDKLKIENKNNVFMVGDRNHDIVGAKENNIKSIGALYGYGSRKELENAGADFIVSDISELQTVLLEKINYDR